MFKIRKVNEEGYVLASYLVQNGMNERTLNNYFSKFKTKKSLNFQYFKEEKSNRKWVLYSSIPLKVLERTKLPKEFIVLQYSLSFSANEQKNKKLREIFFILENAWINPMCWNRNMLYYSNFLIDRDKKILFSKTHSVINEVINLKRNENYSLKDIHSMYLKIEKALFWTTNYSYFSQKIIKAEREGITEVLVHDFMRIGRTNYKVTQLVKNRVIFYYANPKRYSYRKITEKVNEELLSRGEKTISISSVKQIVKNGDFKSRADLLRLGNEYSEKNLIPYLRRAEPNHIGELYQIDSTRLNIPFKKVNGDIGYLYLCAIMDVFTKKIIGHVTSDSENFIMIIECIKSAFESFGYIPKQLVHDNHVAYGSEEFRKLKLKLEEYGVYVRAARVGNAKDKAQIERWFKTFNTHYLSDIVGNLGDGIKTKVVGGRAQRELEQLYKKKTLLKTKKDLSQLISLLIKKYNKTKNKKVNDNSKLIKFEKSDIAKLFFKKKVKKVNRSMIHMQIKNENFTYTIKNHDLANKINNRTIHVRYDEMHPDIIYLFNPRTKAYYGCLKSDKLISIVPSNEELIEITKHNSMIRERVQKSFDDLVEEIDNGKLELESIPAVQILNNEEHLNRIIAQAEDELLISEVINNSKKRRRTMKKSDIKKRYLSDKYYNKVRRKRIKLLDTDD